MTPDTLRDQYLSKLPGVPTDESRDLINQWVLIIFDLVCRAFGGSLRAHVAENCGSEIFHRFTGWNFPHNATYVAWLISSRDPHQEARDCIMDAWANENVEELTRWAWAYADYVKHTSTNPRARGKLSHTYLVSFSKVRGFRTTGLVLAPKEVKELSKGIWGWCDKALAAGSAPRCYGRPYLTRFYYEARDIARAGEELYAPALF